MGSLCATGSPCCYCKHSTVRVFIKLCAAGSSGCYWKHNNNIYTTSTTCNNDNTPTRFPVGWRSKKNAAQVRGIILGTVKGRVSLLTPPFLRDRNARGCRTIPSERLRYILNTPRRGARLVWTGQLSGRCPPAFRAPSDKRYNLL